MLKDYVGYMMRLDLGDRIIAAICQTMLGVVVIPPGLFTLMWAVNETVEMMMR